MNSGEIARLAGVSVRTLRHYHQVGVLPEPHRRANGYREYTVRDLILLLRVRRLTEIGVALDEIPALLKSAERADSVLAQLDAELATQIARLTARRDVIARLRAAGASPDTPPDLAGLLGAHDPAGVPPAVLAQDRDLSILLHHMLDEDGRRELRDLYASLNRPELLAEMYALTARFAALDAETPEREREELLSAYGHMFARVFADGYPAIDAPQVDSLFADYQDAAFNDTQRAFLARAVREFLGADGKAPEETETPRS
ncbi:DNA-binding transcriptional MerR regulator [Catenuloplanes nepalensis]|uniref:DNA-binding transcriptional MerR regulator n=1 Tax=Catenuloplanes nepalensis TaxID=587533 RepID=A0ABT9MUV5_9ACTN|nr:MerR family transcriptional regulator [Catenuloplanes nepalensis]MDP9795180.1 DNA-binding transcriptional MerR regulator [Catenuloplanes nepalensis]